MDYLYDKTHKSKSGAKYQVQLIQEDRYFQGKIMINGFIDYFGHKTMAKGNVIRWLNGYIDKLNVTREISPKIPHVDLDIEAKPLKKVEKAKAKEEKAVKKVVEIKPVETDLSQVNSDVVPSISLMAQDQAALVLDNVGAYTPLAIDINQQEEFQTDMGYFLLLDDTTEKVQQLVRIAADPVSNESACAKSPLSHVAIADLGLSRIDIAEQLLFLRQAWDRHYPEDLKQCSELAQAMAGLHVSFAQLQTELQAALDRLATDNDTKNKTAHFLFSSVYAPLLFIWDVDLVNQLLLQAILLKRGATSDEKYREIVSTVKDKVNELIQASTSA